MRGIPGGSSARVFAISCAVVAAPKPAASRWRHTGVNRVAWCHLLNPPVCAAALCGHSCVPSTGALGVSQTTFEDSGTGTVALSFGDCAI